MKQNFCVRQHHIPEFLQIGFLINNESNQVNVVLKDRCFKAKPRHVYVEKEFYSEVPDNEYSERTLDQKITDKESEILPIFELLKNTPYNLETTISNEHIIFLNHFFLRNKQITTTFVDSMLENIDKNINALSDSNIIAYQKALDIFVDKYYLELAQALIYQHLGIKSNENITNNLILNKERLKKELIDFMFTHLQNIIVNDLNSLKDNKTYFRRGINFLSLNDFNDSFLKKWKFQLLNGLFVLPDTNFISYSEEWESKFLPIISNEVEYILFPLEKNKLMVIYQNEFPNIHKLNPLLINEYLILNSKSFVTSSLDLEFIIPLQTKLEQNPLENMIFNLPTNNIEELIDKLVQSLEENILPRLINLNQS